MGKRKILKEKERKSGKLYRWERIIDFQGREGELANCNIDIPV